LFYLDVGRQIGVAIQDVEGFAKQRSCPDERTAGAEEMGTVGRVVDVHSPLPTIAVAVGDHFAEIAGANDDPGEAGLPEQTQLMGEKRLPRDVEQQFRDFLSDGPKAGSQATGKNGYWKRRNRKNHEGRNW